MTATNVQKTPLLPSLAEFANRAASTRVNRLGQCLPCSVVSVSGSIVTVKFEIQDQVFTLPQVTMPLFGPEYIRYPIQKGDKGFAIAADAYLGQMSGLGDGTATLNEQPNLSTLMFMPIGNKGFSSPDDTNAVVIYGHGSAGVILRDAGKAVTLTLNSTNITIKGDLVIQGNLQVTGNSDLGTG